LNLINASYLGLSIRLTDLDEENKTFFRYCANRDLRLQKCDHCGFLRYPPTTGCPWCAEVTSTWTPVEGKGEVHTYTEVHHPVQPGFRAHLPYLVLIVELNTQKGLPSQVEGLRIVGNLTDSVGRLASEDIIKQVGIGSRVRMTFSSVAPDLALPQWTLDENLPQPNPWRYSYL